MSDDIAQQVREIIAEHAMLDIDQVTPESGLEALGLDSIGFVEIVFAIEEKFDIQVPYNANNPDDSTFNISSVESITEAIRNLIAQKAG